MDTMTPLARGALGPTLVVGAVVTGVAGFAAGVRGVLGAGVGVVLVVAFFAASILALRAVRRADPVVFFAVAFGVFTVKVLALALTLSLVGDGLAGVLDRTSLAGAVIAAALVWIVAEVRAFVRMRAPLYDLDKQYDLDEQQGTA